MRINERLRLVAPDILWDEITIEDPGGAREAVDHDVRVSPHAGVRDHRVRLRGQSRVRGRERRDEAANRYALGSRVGRPAREAGKRSCETGLRLRLQAACRLCGCGRAARARRHRGCRRRRPPRPPSASSIPRCAPATGTSITSPRANAAPLRAHGRQPGPRLRRRALARRPLGGLHLGAARQPGPLRDRRRGRAQRRGAGRTPADRQPRARGPSRVFRPTAARSRS